MQQTTPPPDPTSHLHQRYSRHSPPSPYTLCPSTHMRHASTAPSHTFTPCVCVCVQHVLQGGELELSLLLGDPSVPKGVSAPLGSIVLPEGASGAAPKTKLLTADHQPVSNIKPAIEHTFVSAGRRVGKGVAEHVFVSGWGWMLVTGLWWIWGHEQGLHLLCQAASYRLHEGRRMVHLLVHGSWFASWFTSCPVMRLTVIRALLVCRCLCVLPPLLLLQRPPAKRPPAVVSLAFTGLSLAPLVVLIVYLGTLGVNLKVWGGRGARGRGKRCVRGGRAQEGGAKGREGGGGRSEGRRVGVGMPQGGGESRVWLLRIGAVLTMLTVWTWGSSCVSVGAPCGSLSQRGGAHVEGHNVHVLLVASLDSLQSGPRGGVCGRWGALQQQRWMCI